MKIITILITLLIFEIIGLGGVVYSWQNETSLANDFCKQNGFDNYGVDTVQEIPRSCVKFGNGNVTFRKIYIDYGNELTRLLSNISYGLIPRDELQIRFLEEMKWLKGPVRWLERLKRREKENDNHKECIYIYEYSI